MTYSNHDSRQRFARIKDAVRAVPSDPATGTGWLETQNRPATVKPPGGAPALTRASADQSESEAA